MLSSAFAVFLFVTLSLASAWPRPQEIGLGLRALASAGSASISASSFWPRLASLSEMHMVLFDGELLCITVLAVLVGLLACTARVGSIKSID